MMSKKQWFILLCLFSLYLLFGAGVFFHVESIQEKEKIKTDEQERKDIAILLNSYCNKSLETDKNFKKLIDYCGKPITFKIGSSEASRKWDFYNSLFFVITVVSTIGYGNLAPTTTFSRLFMIFYGLIGIPMNGIVMVSLGDYFGRSFTKLYRRWKTTNMKYDTTRLGLISQVILYSIPGFTFFIILPSVIMVFFEGWTYDMAVYYSFVTLTTIGFGDLVAGTENIPGLEGFYYTIYKIFLIVWIIGGLGYVVMILGFITRGMRSKKIKDLEHMIANNIKRTPQKIRTELRLLLNEFLLMKVKRVYKHDFEFTPSGIQATQSCPDLTIYRDQDSATFLRKRAFSECPQEIVMDRVQSDSDLHMIDKEQTFRPADALLQQKDLLLKVVDALSYASEATINITEEDGGINMFSDSQILSTERHGSCPLASNGLHIPNARRRAKSEVKTPVFLEGEKDSETTWYGQAAKELQKKLKSLRSRNETNNANSSFFTKIKKFKFKPTKDDKNVDVEEQGASQDKTPIETKNNSIPIIFTEDETGKSKPLDKEYSETQNYLQNTSRGRGSAFAYPETRFRKANIRSRAFSVDNDLSTFQRTRRNRSIFEDTIYSRQNDEVTASSSSIQQQQQSVLENTSIADFIRALTAITVPEAAADKDNQRTVNVPSQVRVLPRSRRLPIRPTFQQRRSSLMPSPTNSGFRLRRLSLSPVEENILVPPPPYTPLSDSSTRTGRFQVVPTNRQFLGPFQVPEVKTEKPKDNSS